MRSNEQRQNKYQLSQPIFYNSKLTPQNIPPSFNHPYPQQYHNQNPYNKYRNFTPNTNTTDWHFRYCRNGYIPKYILSEDDSLIAEHIEALKRKKQFDFTSLSQQETIQIFYHNLQIQNTFTTNSFYSLPFIKPFNPTLS